MNEVIATLDLPRLRRERRYRLAAEMVRHDLSALLLLGRANVQYLTGAGWRATDAGHAHQFPQVACFACDDELPYLFTPYPEEAPPELQPRHVHEAVHPECEEGVRMLARRLRDVLGRALAGRVGLDEATAPMHLMLADLLPEAQLVDPAPALAAARAVKTPDEIECIRRAQQINDLAMCDVHAALRPGIRPCELTGLFQRRIFELGAHANIVDPIWQPVPERTAAGPFTVNGEVAFPLPPSDRPLRAGDVLWVDTGMSVHGYVSDFGRTWIVGADPSSRQRAQFARWRETVERVLARVRPGATGADLTRAAIAGEPRRPWLRHLYLAHGAGLDSAEAPLVGTDLGDDFDHGIVLAPGMILVLEPVIWEEGFGGYRAEDIVALTESGYERLSEHPFDPFA